MRQILQNLRNGQTEIVDVPRPRLKLNHMLIHTSHSLISVGTERMLIDFGKANFIDKAKKQPDKVRMVLDKIKTDGLLTTLDAVQSKLDQPLPMGYCNVGTVVECDKSQSDFNCGDRVISNGNHAEVVCVPNTLCARIPDNVTAEAASFTVIGAIALQGVRLAKPTLGETFVVTGLGLVGLMAVQLLRIHGCRVIGIDFDSSKCEIARQYGAETVDLSKGEDPVATANQFSRGRGVDGVLIAASSKSNEPVHQAALMCRKRGRIVLVGVVGLQLSRADFFEKELTFQVSCSYGPGRYDPKYEDLGQDYPFAYVRWTEQRNFEAVLDMLAEGRLEVDSLISHRYPFQDAVIAYGKLAEDRSALGILLAYEQGDVSQKTILLQNNEILPQSVATDPVLGFLGAGNYAGRVLIPAFKSTGAHLLTVASSGGVSGIHAARKNGIREATTDTDGLLADSRLNTVVISTRHNSHADFVCRALEAGKHVFVEKPLCLTMSELEKIRTVYSAALSANTSPLLLMVGFNRRFAPHIQKIKTLLGGNKEPLSLIMTVNAGHIPPDHWTQDVQVGGGRIIGEACHFVDLLRFLVGVQIESSSLVKLGTGAGDTTTITLSFVDGSIGTIHYFANGSKKFAKERLEIFTGGRILQLDNFRLLSGFGWDDFRKMRLLSQNKGQKECANAFAKAISGGLIAPIPFEELLEVSRVVIELAQV